MSYIDYSFYRLFAPSSTLSEEQFSELERSAVAIVDVVTFSRINEAGGLAALSADVQTSIKNATAAQVETLSVNGGAQAAAGGGALQQATVGKFSYTLAQAQGRASVMGLPLSALALMYLEPTGMLARSVNAGARP